MSHKVIFDVAAQVNLANLYDYLLPKAGERDARAYVADILTYCASFDTFPERGTLLDKQRGLRTIGFHRRATIAFEVNAHAVIIMRIFHRGQDIKFD